MQSIGTAATKKFNLAVQGARRPGSTFKTVALTTAVDAGINPASTSYTSRSGATIWGCGSDYAPETFDRRSGGRLSLERATILSDNSVYAQLSADLGVDA